MFDKKVGREIRVEERTGEEENEGDLQSEAKTYELGEIMAVQGVKKGHDGNKVNTIHF